MRRKERLGSIFSGAVTVHGQEGEDERYSTRTRSKRTIVGTFYQQKMPTSDSLPKNELLKELGGGKEAFSWTNVAGNRMDPIFIKL
jgi:hypothetical protein